jgi:hypothetical protein
MWLIASLVAFMAGLAIHAILCRFPVARGGALGKFLAGGALIGLILTAIIFWIYGFSTFSIASLLLYAALCELYLFLFNSVKTSISANLLVLLAERELTELEIHQTYDDRTMVERRIDRLRAAGLVKLGPEGLQVTAKGEHLLMILSSMRRFFRHAS